MLFGRRSSGEPGSNDGNGNSQLTWPLRVSNETQVSWGGFLREIAPFSCAERFPAYAVAYVAEVGQGGRTMPQPPVAPDPKLDFLLAVERLLTAADQARHKRDRLLELTRLPSNDAAKQEPAGQEALR